MLFSVCDELDTRKRTTRASRMAAAVKEASPPSSESEEEVRTSRDPKWSVRVSGASPAYESDRVTGSWATPKY